MTLSQSSEINLTDNGKQALKAQISANNAYSLANGAQDLANGAQKTADGKNSVYRGTDPSTVPKTGLKEGDIYFTDNALYTWNGSAWEETVSDTTGAEIHAKVEAAMQESQKADADLRSNIESKAKELDASIQSTKTDMTAATNAVASDLSTTKSNLDAVSKDLSATKSSMASDLNTVKSDLSSAKSDLATVSSDLSTTKNNLADTGQELETAVSDFQKKTDQLSGSLETANSKIEFNSNAIAEVKQTAEEVSTTVSNIRVGGRNLLTDTRTLSSWTNEHNGWTDTGQTFQGGAIWECNQNSHWAKVYEYYNVKAGETYTFSVYLKSTTTVTNNANIYIASSDPENGQPSAQPNPTGVNVAITNVWKRYAVTFTSQKDGIIKPRVELGNDAVDTVQMALPKLEAGTTATDWTPAPEDTDQAISKVSQTADTIRADLTNTQGDVASVKAKADSLTSSIANAQGDISNLQQRADSITSTLSNGGRNLLSNTREMNDPSIWGNLQVWDKGDFYNDGINKCQIVQTNTQQWNGLKQYVEVQAGKKYIFSIDAKSGDNSNHTAYFFASLNNAQEGQYNNAYATGDGQELNYTPTWNRYSFIITANMNGYLAPRIERGTTTNEILQLARPQFECGDTATPWQPSNGDISSLQQTASGLSTRVGDAEGNISSLQQTASGLQSTVGQMPAQWQQAINDKTNAQVLDSDVDMNNLTTAGTYLIKDFSVKNAPFSAWFMATVEATADKSRVVQRVKRDSDNIAYERSNMDTGWTAWERVATGSDISNIQQTINGITTRVGDTEGNVSTLQQTSKDLTTRVGNTEGNISQLQQTAGKITTTLSNGGVNLLNNSQGNFQPANSVIDNYQRFQDTSIYMKQGQKYTLSALSGPNGFYFSDSHVTTEESQRILLWLVSLDGNINQIISSDTTDSSLGGTHFTWNYPSDTYFLRVNSYDTQNRGYAYHVQIEYGDTATPWKPSTGDISQLQQTASQLTSDMKDAKGNISSFQQTAGGLTSRVGSAEDNISQLQQDSKGFTSRVGSAESNISQLQQTADRIKFSMAGQGLDLVDGLDGELVMGYGIPNTTWNDPNASLTLPTTPTNGEVLPQNGTAFALAYNWEAGKTYTQSIIIETDAQIDTSVQPQWTWLAAEGHNQQPAELINLGNNCYRLIGSYTPNSNDVKAGVRILDIWNFTSFVNVTTGTYLKFRSPHFFCADDNSLSELKITADGINAYVKKSENSQILSSILSMDPQNSTIAQVVNGKPIAAINLSSEGDVTIDGKKLHITASTTIDDATIKSSMIESLEATKIKAGTLDASKIQVINLDANSITTGSFSAVLGKNLNFKTYTVSPSSPWDFNDTKSIYGNWFLNGDTSDKYFWNGPSGLAPWVYVQSRGSADGTRFVTTVWRDYDPTQYQRTWTGDHWTNWVTLPNSQNIVSVINLSPDGVTINGKNIELNGDTTITGQLNLLPKDQQTVSQFNQGLYNPWSWKDSKVFAESGGIQLQSTVTGQQYSNDYTSVSGLVNGSSPAITTLAPTYLKFTLYKSWGDFNNNYSNQLARTYIDAGRIETNDVFAGGIRLFDSKIRGLYGSVYVTNFNGTNFDNAGGVGFQVWGGIGLGQSTIYTPGTDLYVQQGNVGPALGQSYSSSAKTEIHCKTVTTQVANTVTSQLSVKTAITKVDYNRALMAIQNTDMYDYRYISDESNQHYVSGIIDDVHDTPEYNMDPMLINQERTARIDANLLGYHHVVLQDILKRLDKLEAKVNQD